MSYESFREQQKCWGLDRDEEQFLEHCFFVNGNGYDWKDGELVDGYTDEERSRMVAELDANLKYMDEQFEKTIDDLVSNFGAIREEILNSKSESEQQLEDKRNNYPREIYPICCFACINHLPDDIKPDWLDAAKRAVAFARSDRAIITDEDSEWLDKAEARIEELERK